LPLAAVLIVTVFLVWQRHTRWGRPLLFAWAFFGIALLPVLGFVDVGFMQFSLVADHYQYTAIIGVLALLAAAFSYWHAKKQSFKRPIAIVSAALIGVALIAIARKQTSLYVDDFTLFQATLQNNPNSSLVHNNFGLVLYKRGKTQDALSHYQQSLKLNPSNPEANTNLGVVLMNDLDRPQDAISYFEMALQIRPEYAEAHSDLGSALAKTGHLEQAIAEFQQALQRKPNQPAIHFNLANTMVKAGQTQKAIEHYQRALELQPGLVEARANLAMAYAKTQRPAEALRTAQEALDSARSQGQLAAAQRLENWLKNYRTQQAAPSAVPPENGPIKPDH
jgi:tetratricopeptide (TPR) repeat protein